MGLSPPMRGISSGRAISPFRVVRLIRRRAVRQNCAVNHIQILAPVDRLATALALATAARAASPRAVAALPTAAAVMPRAQVQVIAAPVFARLHHSVSSSLSPPMRGNLVGLRPPYPICRSIPAYAGESSGLAPAVSDMSVYPRPRGEPLRPSHLPNMGKGLPPPTRGTPNPHFTTP